MALPATVGGNITAADINTLSAFPVANFAALPTVGNFVGRQIATLDTGVTHRWNGAAWRADGGIYVDFTPLWPNITVGNATVNQGRVSRIGNTVNFYARLRFGTTTAMGVNPFFILPISQANPSSNGMFQLELLNNFDNWYAGHAAFTGTTDFISLNAFGTGAANMQPTTITPTVPFTWNNDDWIKVSGTYEAIA
jgi:hypothetical protein